MRSTLFLLLIMMIAGLTVGGQTATVQDDSDDQSWNDLQLTVPLDKHFDFVTKLTLRFGKNVTRLNDGRYQLGIAWKPTKYLSISPYYWLVNARNAAGLFRTEHRLSIAVTYKFPIKTFGLSHRSTIERRMRQPVDTWRYRAMMTIDKELPKHWLKHTKAFVSDEVFYDSALSKFSRNRFSIGITRTVTKQLSLDIFYMRQNDGHVHPGDLNAIGTAWKIHL